MSFNPTVGEVRHVRIGELAERSGVSVRLLRYYEQQGLLTAGRTSGGQREYAADAPAAVARIRTLLDAGLPTRVIHDLLPCFVGDGPELDACVFDLLHEQLDDLDTRITALGRARASLSGILDASTHALASR